MSGVGTMVLAVVELWRALEAVGVSISSETTEEAEEPISDEGSVDSG